MLSLILAFLAALTFTEFTHNMFETWGARQKVQWLKARMDGQVHGRWPLNINTLAKVLTLHGVIFLVITIVGFGILTLLQLAPTTLALIAVVTLILNYVYTTLVVHAYHEEIGELLRRFKQK